MLFDKPFFFFQAEDGIRDVAVTGVQTCALPILRAFDTRLGRAAILICEDAWHSLSATIAAVDGAQLILLPSASPARGAGRTEEGDRLPASVVRWERIVRGIAEEHGVWVVYASLVGFEGGKGFPGGSLVVDASGEIH